LSHNVREKYYDMRRHWASAEFIRWTIPLQSRLRGHATWKIPCDLPRIRATGRRRDPAARFDKRFDLRNPQRVKELDVLAELKARRRTVACEDSLIAATALHFNLSRSAATGSPICLRS